MITIIIDGEIGAGKTTLISILANHIKRKGKTVVVVTEPVDKWVSCGILQHFYQDPKRYAYEFQTYTYVTRIQTIVDKTKHLLSQPDFLILERSILTDKFVFMELQKSYLDPTLYDMYVSWWGLYPFISEYTATINNAYHIYLKPKLELCMDRVRKRDREGEKETTLSISYQERLRKVHEAFLEGTDIDSFSFKKSDLPFDWNDVLIIREPANEDFRLNPTTICTLFDNWIEKIIMK